MVGNSTIASCVIDGEEDMVFDFDFNSLVDFDLNKTTPVYKPIPTTLPAFSPLVGSKINQAASTNVSVKKLPFFPPPFPTDSF